MARLKFWFWVFYFGVGIVWGRVVKGRTLWAQRDSEAAFVEELEPVEAHVERVAPRGQQTQAQHEAERHVVPAGRPVRQ